MVVLQLQLAVVNVQRLVEEHAAKFEMAVQLNKLVTLEVLGVLVLEKELAKLVKEIQFINFVTHKVVVLVLRLEVLILVQQPTRLKQTIQKTC